MHTRIGTTWRRLALLALPAPLLLAVAAPSSASGAPDHPSRAASALAPKSAECRANRAAGTITFASPFGYDASAGIIDVYAAIKLGYFHDLCLDVHFVDSPFGEATMLVSAGTAQFTGEGSAADALVAEENGNNFVGISTFGDTSDYVLLTRKGIDHLKQLEGKVLGYHVVLPVVLHEMLVRAGVDLKKVTMVNDTTYNPMLLIKGDYDGLQAYESNEPITLRADHQPFTMWTPAQFGVSGTFNVQVVNRRFLAQHASATADFVRAELEAFGYCVKKPDVCVQLLVKASPSTINAKHALQEWAIESTLAQQHHVAGMGIGAQTLAEWHPEAAAVYRYGLVKRPVNLAHDEDTSLAASLYDGTKLRWP